MDIKKVYDIVTESEKTANLIHEEKNNSVNLSLVDMPIISESEGPVYTNAFTKTKTLRDGYLVKSRSIYGRKNN